MASRFARNRAALISSVVLSAIIAAAVIIPAVWPYPPDQVNLAVTLTPPSHAHWLGTDQAGRDVFARLWAGARVSLAVGFTCALVSVSAGGLLGCVAGLARGTTESVIMRLTDISLSVPGILLIVVLGGIFRPGITILIAGITATHWGPSSRVAHGMTLSARERDYVLAATAAGARSGWLLRKHIIPAALPPLIVSGTLAVASAILLEAALSFLGLGVVAPQASWGTMLASAQSLTFVESAPWLWLPPGLAITLTVLAVNFIGDGLRDALEPRQATGARRWV